MLLLLKVLAAHLYCVTPGCRILMHKPKRVNLNTEKAHIEFWNSFSRQYLVQLLEVAKEAYFRHEMECWLYVNKSSVAFYAVGASAAFVEFRIGSEEQHTTLLQSAQQCAHKMR